MLIKQARFSFVKTMDEFNLDGQENLTSWHFEKLSKPNWIDEKYNVLIIGSAGTEKTHLSVAIGLKTIRNNKRVFYTTVNELLYLLKTKDTVMKSKTRLNFIDECSLLILDELGYTPLNRDDMLTLYEKVDSYNKRKSIVVITNRDFEGWADIFHDEVIATTLLDRIIENCQVIHLTGGSYRLRSHQGIFDTK